LYSNLQNSLDMLLTNTVIIKLAVAPHFIQSALLMEDDRVVIVTSKINPI
jgi:hypothetical protein